MKYINKFIAIGLGFALVFTGTSFSQGWFESECIRTNCVTINKYKYAFFHDRRIAAGKDYIYIPIDYIDYSFKQSVEYATITNENNKSITFDKKNISIVTKDDIGNSLGNNKAYPVDSSYYIKLAENMSNTVGDGNYFDFKLSINIKLENQKIRTYNYDIKINKDITIRNEYIIPYHHKVYPITATLKSYTDSYSIKFEGLEKGNEDSNLVNEQDIIELPSEEVNIPSEPEVVEPPKEEVELPSEPEVIKPPKEEVELPSESEVVEPPKEEVQAPIESDIALPNQMDIIAQKKDEDLE